LGCKNAEISIVIVDDEEITRLNRQYFQRQGATNVISFPMQGGKTRRIQPQILGDVVISADTAKRHASAAGIKTGEELLFLLVHGILHLVGYDHEDFAAERRDMEAKEAEIFEQLVRRASKREISPRSKFQKA
jgi:probable rRNA maturation factor